jgi:hypothetical protein
VFLLQPCELVFEFALIFVGHGLRSPKNAMRLRKGAEAAWREYRPWGAQAQAGAGSLLTIPYR